MSNADMNTLSPRWEKLKIISVVLGTVLIPLVLALIGQWYTAALKQNEIGVKYVELSLSILRAPPEPQTHNLRAWAIAVVDQYSQVPLSDKAQDELRRQDLSDLLKMLHDTTMVPIRNIR